MITSSRLIAVLALASLGVGAWWWTSRESTTPHDVGPHVAEPRGMTAAARASAPDEAIDRTRVTHVGEPDLSPVDAPDPSRDTDPLASLRPFHLGALEGAELEDALQIADDQIAAMAEQVEQHRSAMDPESLEDLRTEADLMQYEELSRQAAHLLRGGHYVVLAPDDVHRVETPEGRAMQQFPVTRNGNDAILVVLVDLFETPALLYANDYFQQLTRARAEEIVESFNRDALPVRRARIERYLALRTSSEAPDADARRFLEQHFPPGVKVDTRLMTISMR